MEKIKYDSLYKFIVSIGIAIIVFPFIFMVWIFNFNDIVVLSNNEISQLTDVAQNIIHMEQNYKYILLSHPIICLFVISIIVLTGVLIALYGIKEWKNKVQKYEDKLRELSNKLIEKQIQALTPEEKEEKVREEIILNNQTNDKEPEKSNTKVSLNSNKIQKYMQIEKEVLDKIKKVFKKYEIYEEIRLDKQRYDCIALKKEDGFLDYIFEIKYFTRVNSIKGKLGMLEREIIHLEYTYMKNTERNAELILIIIVDQMTEEQRVESKKYIEQKMGLSKVIISDIDNIEEDLKKIKRI